MCGQNSLRQTLINLKKLPHILSPDVCCNNLSHNNCAEILRFLRKWCFSLSAFRQWCYCACVSVCGTLPVMTNRYLVDISGFSCVGLHLFFFKKGRFVGGRKGFRRWGVGVFKNIQYALWKRGQGIKGDYQQCEEKRQENEQDGGNWEKRQIRLWQLSTKTIKHDYINMSMDIFVQVYFSLCVCVCARHLGHHSVCLVGDITSYTSNSSASAFLLWRRDYPVLIDDIDFIFI